MSEENKLFPGLPDYIGPAYGVFSMLHHESLAETSNDVMERIAYIKENKPAQEISTRLRHIMFLDSVGESYLAKRKPLDDGLLTYIKQYILDCKWDGEEIVF